MTDRPQLEHSLLPRARQIAGALLAAPLALTALLAWVPSPSPVAGLELPAALLGTVSPVLGYRLTHWMRERLPSSANEARRGRAFLAALSAALLVTGGVAVLCGLVAVIARSWLPLIGVATHVLLAGALWPSAERLERFVDDDPQAPVG